MICTNTLQHLVWEEFPEATVSFQPRDNGTVTVVLYVPIEIKKGSTTNYATLHGKREGVDVAAPEVIALDMDTCQRNAENTWKAMRHCLMEDAGKLYAAHGVTLDGQ